MSHPFEVFEYQISTSHDVDQLVDTIVAQSQRYLLVHIAAFMQNTVLVQSLSQKLSKRLPEAEIVLLKGDREKGAEVTLFTCEKLWSEGQDVTSLSHLLLHTYRQENRDLENHLDICKSQVIRRHFIDPLTELPNLYQLRDDLDGNDDGTFICLNIDNFKLINDFYGFLVGDYILEETARNIRALVGEVPVYRMYGDEFGVLVDRKMSFYELKRYLDELSMKLHNIHLRYGDTSIYVDMTLASSASSSYHNAFAKVSMALKYAKENRLPYWIYEDRMHFEHQYESNLKIAAKVRNAVESSGIVPYFQPIVCNRTDQVVKFECLSRLLDDKGNILPPKAFMQVAKTIKVYNEVTKSILDKSFKVFESNTFDFSINLSIEDVLNHDITGFIMQRLEANGMGPRVTFELLESESVEDYHKVSEFITEVRRHGAKVAIDDFGSGFSNFSYLAQIDVDYIKIDGALIAEIDKNHNSRVITETIVSFAKSVGIETVAEYVHSSTVLSAVKEIGVDYSQGYYIDQPLPELPEESSF